MSVGELNIEAIGYRQNAKQVLLDIVLNSSFIVLFINPHSGYSSPNAKQVLYELKLIQRFLKLFKCGA